MNKIKSDQVFYFIAIAAISIIVFVARRPDIILNPQFWAEDGKIWFEQAYNMGPMRSILLPQNGYYQTISKIVASASLALPLYAAPLFFNLMALLVRSLMVAYILSPRLDRYPLAGRMLLSAYILLMPHLSEVHANVTNTHWYLSIWLLMVLISKPATGIYWRIHDYLILIIAGLSGPFIIFMAPVILLRILDGEIALNPISMTKTLARKMTPFSVTFFLIFLIQMIAILFTVDAGRSDAPLGANFKTLFSILSAKIFAGFILTEAGVDSLWDMHVINAAVTLLGLSFLVFILIRGDWREKSLAIFPVLVIAFSLARPMISLDQPQWPMIRHAGERYLLIPHVLWMALLLIGIGKLHAYQAQRALFVAACIIVSVTGFLGFRLPPLPESNWIDQVSKYNHASVGKTVELKINPDGWNLHLNKKPTTFRGHPDAVLASQSQRRNVQPGGYCALDAIGGTPAARARITAGETVVFAGWLGDTDRRVPEEAGLALSSDATTYLFPVSATGQRPDVAEALGARTLRTSGFNSSLNMTGVPAGTYRASIIMSGTPEVECPLEVDVIIE